MDTDRLMVPSKDVQQTMVQLWSLLRQVGEALTSQQNEDSEARTRVVYLEAELESMAANIHSQSALLDQLREEVQVVEDLRSTLAELKEQNVELRSDDERLRAELEAARTESRETSATEREISELQLELTAITVRAQNMENVLQDRGRELAVAHVVNEQLQEELRKERNNLQQYEASQGEIRIALETRVADLERVVEDLQRGFVQKESEWESEKRELQAQVESVRAEQRSDDGSAARYASLVDEMSVTIAELEQKVQTAESRLHEYEELKKKSSKAPTLIEGMLRADVESLSARVAQLEEERATWTSESSDDSQAIALKSERRERLHGIAEKLRTAIDILERSVSPQ